MSTKPNYISEAYNTSALMTGVNPQTGSLQASVKIADISAGVMIPASFTLTLSVGPQTLPTLRTTGFSQNVHLYYAAFNIPRIDIRNNRMYFADGSVEELVNTTDAYSFLYRKVRDIKITKKFDIDPVEKTDPWFLVEYKGGMAEYYDIYGLLVRMVSPTGHYLEFSYSNNMCYKIEAKTGTTDKTAGTDIAKEVLSKLEISYINGVPVSVTKTLFPAGTAPVTETATISNKMVCKSLSWFGGCDPLDQEHYITRVQLPTDERPYVFEYQEVTSPRPLSLNRITTPHGGVYSVTFHPRETLKYGNVEETMQYIPAVKTFQFSVEPIPDHTTGPTLKAGDIFQTFSFPGENNFTGYSSTGSYTPQLNRDNCLLKAEDYTYTTVEETDFRSYKLKTTRTYNRFHLMTEEIKDYNHNEYFREKNVYVYEYIDSGLSSPGNIEAQTDCRFSFWTTRTTTYEKIKDGAVETGKVRTEQWTREYDDWGNLTKEKLPSNIENQYVYYSESGEAGSCDAAPFGLRCYLKTATIVGKSMPTNKVTAYKYMKVSGNNSSFILITPPHYSGPEIRVSVNPFILLPSEVTENSTLITTCSYQSTGATFIARMLTGVLTGVRNTTTTLETAMKEGWEIDAAYTTLTHKRWIESKVLPGTETLTRRIDESAQRLADGRLMSCSVPNNTSDTGVNTTTYGYDARSRLTEVRDYSNQAGYEETETIAYTPFNSDTMSTTVARTLRKITETTMYNFKLLPVEMKREVEGYANPTTSYYYYDTDDTLVHSEFVEDTLISINPEQSANIRTTNSVSHYPLYNKTDTAAGALFFQDSDPVLRSRTERADGSEIKFEIMFNEYGKIASVRQYGTVVNRESVETVIDQKLSGNVYDGFGRLTRAITFTGDNTQEATCYSQVDYVYDIFDRVTEEKVSEVSPEHPASAPEIIQTTTWTYGADIANFNSAVSITCKDSTNYTVVNASRKYDGFGRLTELTTNDAVPAGNIVTRYTYASTNDDQPSTITTGSTSVAYTYDTVTGLPAAMVMTNTTGPNHPLNTRTRYTYKKDTKLLESAGVYPLPDTVMLDPLSIYSFKYNANEVVDEISYSCIQIGNSGQNDNSYIQSKFFYNRQSNGKPWFVTISLQGVHIISKFLSYNSVAAKCSNVTFQYVPYNKEILVDVKYLNNRNSYAIGKPETISISCAGFYTDADYASLNISCTSIYDEFGRESERLHTTHKNEGALDIAHYYDAHSRVKERAVVIKKTASATTGIQYDNQYTYSNSGSSTSLSQSRKTKSILQQDGSASSPETLSQFDYSFNTLLNFENVNNTIGSRIENYSYIKDMPKGIGTEDSALVLTYNSYGNVESVAAAGVYAGETAMITYNALNQPGVFNHFDRSEPDVAKQFTPTAYEYDAYNRVCKITTREYPTATTSTTVFLIYEGDDVSAEIETSNTTSTEGVITTSTIVSRCVYLRVQGMLLGRILETEINTAAPKLYLDWYMTDPSGSVRGVTRYRQGVASTASDAAVTTFFDYSDYGQRTDITTSVPG
ncbi:hypothetical protein [Yokenella regensburgei]|uniref:hypothetical protein n=1 Tax=Yokenella regensburgei TaxID=158877 RepID=UPI0031DC6A9C